MEKKNQKINSSYNLKDLKLSKYKINKLKNISSEILKGRHSFARYGLNNKIHRKDGHIALFTGKDNKSKTIAAKVIANELNLDLYKIDLSTVKTKYIGETEKNLDKVFKSAESKDWILFFDEADALFGKRSKVKDAHDRYANIELNYLLQRIESFRGLVILATNKKTNLDDAFLRRLRFVLNFPDSKEDKRTSLWRKGLHK